MRRRPFESRFQGRSREQWNKREMSSSNDEVNDEQGEKYAGSVRSFTAAEARHEEKDDPFERWRLAFSHATQEGADRTRRVREKTHQPPRAAAASSFCFRFFFVRSLCSLLDDGIYFSGWSRLVSIARQRPCALSIPSLAVNLRSSRPPAA